LPSSALKCVAKWRRSNVLLIGIRSTSHKVSAVNAGSST
jgi:hypothetical protein